MSIRWYQGSTSSPISMEYSLLNTNYADSGTISGSFTTNSTTGKVFLGIKSSSSTGSMFSWDNFTLMITPTVPEAPILTLQSLNSESTSVKLSWTPPYDGGSSITNYKIYQRVTQNSITSTTIDGLTIEDTNITMSNLNYNVTYTFTIEAINKLGSSSKSIAKTITPMNVIPPNYWG